MNRQSIGRIKQCRLSLILLVNFIFILAGCMEAQGLQFSFTPEGTFPNVESGKSYSLTIKMKNTGNKTVTLNSYSFFSGSGLGGVFARTSGTCGTKNYALKSGKTCTHVLTFSPQAAQTYKDTFQVHYYPNNSSELKVEGLALIGLGTSSTPVVEGKLEVINPSLHGDVIIGEKKVVTYEFQNVGGEKIRVDEYYFEPAESVWKKIGGTCKEGGFIVNPQEKCSYQVELAPTSARDYVSKFVVGYYPGDRWDWRSLKVSLQGSGKEQTPEPTPTDPLVVVTAGYFGSVNVGSSKSSTFTFKNDGTESVKFDTLTFSDPQWSYLGGTCKVGLNLNAGATCTMDIKFAPNQEGSSQENLQIGYLIGTSALWRELQVALQAEATVVTPAPVTGKLHVEGKYIKNELGQVVTLYGVNIADPQHLNNKPHERPGVTALSVAKDAIENYKAKVIRIPVHPGSSPSSSEGWFSSTNGGEKYFKDHLDPLVQYITSQKVYAIVDLHYVADYLGKWPNVQAFWSYIAPKYKDNPYVIFELYNEPILPDNWDTWKTEIAQPGVNLIRQHAPDTLIIVGGPYWTTHMWGAATNPVSGTNLVYAAHVYPIQTPEKWERNYGAVVDKFPVFVSEWGWELENNPPTSTGTTSGFGQPFHDWMKARGLSWTAWILDPRWEPRMVDTNWVPKGGEGGMGVFIRDRLWENHQNPGSGVPATTTVDLIKSGESWKYLDNGSNQGTAWYGVAFNDSLWKTGVSPLGYGDGDEATIVSYGPSSSQKYVTTYFRRTFNVSDVNGVQSVVLQLLRDDGAVVYVNGQEVHRSNMPSGTISYTTFASSAVADADENVFHQVNLSPSVLKTGTNIIAVEVHQSTAGSSDLSFDLKLKVNVSTSSK